MIYSIDIIYILLFKVVHLSTIKIYLSIQCTINLCTVAVSNLSNLKEAHYSSIMSHLTSLMWLWTSLNYQTTSSRRVLISMLSEKRDKARRNLKFLQFKVWQYKAWWNTQHLKKNCTKHWLFKVRIKLI